MSFVDGAMKWWLPCLQWLCPCRQYACPRCPADCRPAKPLKKKKHKLGLLTSDSSSSSGSSGTGLLAATGTTSPSHDSAEQQQQQQQHPADLPSPTLSPSPSPPPPTSDSQPYSKPKGLIDGLSKFFTPSNKRKSRVSLNTISPQSKKSKKMKHSHDLLVQSVVPHTSGSPSHSHHKQVHFNEPPRKETARGLFDNLSSILTTPDKEADSPPLLPRTEIGRNPPMTGLSVLEKLEAEIEQENFSFSERRPSTSVIDISAPVTFHKSGKKYKLSRKDLSSSTGQKVGHLMRKKWRKLGEGKGKLQRNALPSMMHVTDWWCL